MGTCSPALLPTAAPSSTSALTVAPCWSQGPCAVALIADPTASPTCGHSRYWRVANAGITDWRPEVSELRLYSDEACTSLITGLSGATVSNPDVLCSGYGSGTAASSGCHLAFDGDTGTTWRPACHPCSAGQAWIGVDAGSPVTDVVDVSFGFLDWQRGIKRLPTADRCANSFAVIRNSVHYPQHNPDSFAVIRNPVHQPQLAPDCIAVIRNAVREPQLDPRLDSIAVIQSPVYQSRLLPTTDVCNRVQQRLDNGLVLIAPGDVDVEAEFAPEVAHIPSLRVAVSVMPPRSLPRATGRINISVGSVVHVRMAQEGHALHHSPGNLSWRLRIPVSPPALQRWPCTLAARFLDDTSGDWGPARPVTTTVGLGK
eukprot:gene31156-biopygen104383